MTLLFKTNHLKAPCTHRSAPTSLGFAARKGWASVFGERKSYISTVTSVWPDSVAKKSMQKDTRGRFKLRQQLVTWKANILCLCNIHSGRTVIFCGHQMKANVQQSHIGSL